MTGCSITRGAPSLRRSSDITPAIEVIDLAPPDEIDKLPSGIDFVNTRIDYYRWWVDCTSLTLQDRLPVDAGTRAGNLRVGHREGIGSMVLWEKRQDSCC
jgi:hypothetical protein